MKKWGNVKSEKEKKICKRTNESQRAEKKTEKVLHRSKNREVEVQIEEEEEEHLANRANQYQGMKMIQCRT